MLLQQINHVCDAPSTLYSHDRQSVLETTHVIAESETIIKLELVSFYMYT